MRRVLICGASVLLASIATYFASRRRFGGSVGAASTDSSGLPDDPCREGGCRASSRDGGSGERIYEYPASISGGLRRELVGGGGSRFVRVTTAFHGLSQTARPYALAPLAHQLDRTSR